ncbi:MAG: hypothetical protein FWC28_06130 [Proteobacteria bacterium]|nr:hypothetical protein [Cystobacterineae bacterium]MCL2258802.1 hypothetical protein [Cystobacterineae bacterium]MCL2314811.1 hypothetical protein [Pseudomonadota bacterium]
MRKSKRDFLPIVFLSVVLLAGCDCKNDKDECSANGCACTGAGGSCTDAGCECKGADCACSAGEDAACKGPGCLCTATGGCSCTTAECQCTKQNCRDFDLRKLECKQGDPDCPFIDPLFPGKGESGKSENGSWGIGTEDVEIEGAVENGGNITLRPGVTRENLHYMWLANTEQGYVSKYDTNTGREVARYLTIFPRGCSETNSGADCSTQDNGLVDVNGPIGYRRTGIDSTTGQPYSVLEGVQPSRTAIDYNGDAWVGNRAKFDGQERPGLTNIGVTKRASMTKVANSFVPERCRNGGAKTSSDANGNGVIDADEWYHPNRPGYTWNWTDPNSYDDCVLFTTLVCNPITALPLPSDPYPNETAGVRAVAVAQGESSAGDAWAGCWSDSKLVHLHGDTGAILHQVDLDIRPYGAIADRDGRVWAVQKEGGVVYHAQSSDPQTAPYRETNYFAVQAVNARANPPVALEQARPNEIDYADAYNRCSAYGVGLDAQGRIWLGGRFSEGINICRYDPRDRTWWYWGMSAETDTNTGETFGSARGIAVDTQGWVYFSGNGGERADFNAPEWSITRSQLMVIDSNNPDDPIIPFELDDGSRVRAYDITGTGNVAETGAVGVGLDTNNNAWLVNHTGTAIQFRPDHAAGVVRFGMNTREVFEGALGPNARPNSGFYTYSDFTGYQLRNYASQGRFTRYLTACPNGTKPPVWEGLVWKGSTPPGSSIQVEISSGATREVLQLDTNPGKLYSSEGVYWENEQWFRVDLSDITPGEEARWLEITFHLVSHDDQTAPVLENFIVYSACPGLLG